MQILSEIKIIKCLKVWNLQNSKVKIPISHSFYEKIKQNMVFFSLNFLIHWIKEWEFLIFSCHCYTLFFLQNQIVIYLRYPQALCYSPVQAHNPDLGHKLRIVNKNISFEFYLWTENQINLCNAPFKYSNLDKRVYQSFSQEKCTANPYCPNFSIWHWSFLKTMNWKKKFTKRKNQC